MTVTYGFYNSLNGDRKYNANQLSRLFEGIINDGVFPNIGSSLMVNVGEGMTVNVGEGRAWFNNTWTNNDAILPLTIDPSEVILNRIDAIVLEVGSASDVRTNSIKIIKGTPNSVPADPTLITTTGQHQYPLAYIYIGAGVTSILSANITNKVGTTECPFVTVVGLDALLPEWQQQFDAWFTDLQAQMAGDVATNLQNQINQLSTHPGLTEAHGATGAVVGTTNTQTLSNKTLTNPKISNIYDAILGVLSFIVEGTTSAVNYLKVKSSITSVAPSIEAVGTDANIDINLKPKGTGSLKRNGNVVYDAINSVDKLAKALGQQTAMQIANNTTLESGFAVLGNSDSVAVGLPNNFYHILNFKHVSSDGYNAQLAIPLSAGPSSMKIYVRTSAGGVWSTWVTMWNSLNDGAGSGLDADKLDGFHLSEINASSDEIPTYDITMYSGVPSNYVENPPINTWVQVDYRTLAVPRSIDKLHLSCNFWNSHLNRTIRIVVNGVVVYEGPHASNSFPFAVTQGTSNTIELLVYALNTSSGTLGVTYKRRFLLNLA